MRSGKNEIEDLNFYKEILAKVNAIIYIIDVNTNSYVWGNNKYSEILGYDVEDITLNIFDFAEKYFHPDDKTIVTARMEYFNRNNGDVWSGVFRIKHKEGYWKWVYSKLMTYKRDENGKPTQLLGITIDPAENFETRKRVTELFRERIRSRNHNSIENLTIREIEIIELIAAGSTYIEIADKLCIQPDTVNKHRKNILNKLNLNNIASLISFAKDTGLA